MTQSQNQTVSVGLPAGHRAIASAAPRHIVMTSRIAQRSLDGCGASGTATRGGTRAKSIGIYQTAAPFDVVMRKLPRWVRSLSRETGTRASVMLVPPSTIWLSPWIGHDMVSPVRAARRLLILMQSEPLRIFPPWHVLSPSYASFFIMFLGFIKNNNSSRIFK